jgi:hypothetical protein
MPQAVEPLPNDPNELKAMLLAERARNERLVQIIKEMQRHRFGRRAETLPEDQMLLALEDVEQTQAGNAAQEETRSVAARSEAARRRRRNRGALPAICRASKRSSISRTRAVPAARARYTRSARTSPSGSTLCRRSSVSS